MTFQMPDGSPGLGIKPPTTIISIEPTDSFNPMKLHNGKYTMHLEVDEDTYWGLVKLGAEIRTDSETYAENVLVGLVESELDKQTKD
jgi:hypothetical protein